tara:strand:+ start:57 stop:245 length:189 start_codon:yes stop_codon:yes gene_type:complete
MTFKLVDVTRGKVLQEFETVEQAEKALLHQSVEDYVRLEIQAEVVAKPKPKAKKANVKKESD